MTDSEFNDLIRRYKAGQCTAEEKALLEKWLDSENQESSDPFESEAEKLRIKQALLSSLLQSSHHYLKDTGDNNAGDSSDKVSPGRIISMPFHRIAFGIAASIALIALVSQGALKYYKNTVAEKYAATEILSGNEIQKVLLSDGSIVWLKPGSSLTYPKNFRGKGKRIVSLQGEALFEVGKNPAQPFLVYSGDLTTTVLGTSFNIKTTGEQIEVLVLTGKVSLTSATDKQGIVVLPDEKAVYNGMKKQLVKVETTVEEPVAIVSGTEYSMDFDDTRLSEIISRIEGKFNVTVTMTDLSLGNCMITGDYTDQSLRKTLDIITKTLTAEYEINDNKIILKGKGCD